MVNEIKATGGTEKEIAVIPNGVDTKLFKPLKQRNFNASEKRILHVGRLDARKGVDNLMHAFKDVAKNNKAKLIIAGEGREKRTLIKLSRKLSIPVEFLGKISHDNLPKIYSEADLFVLPSLYEPFGMVAIEAMSCGVPTIVSSACPELGVPRFEKGNVKSLTKLMLEVISSQERLKELSVKGIALSRDYDWENIISEIIRFLKKFV